MLSIYMEKILKEIEAVPQEMMPKLYRIMHIVATELVGKTEERCPRGSLRGIWRGSQINEAFFFEAKKSLFPYEY
jgi:hypothetical protein